MDNTMHHFELLHFIPLVLVVATLASAKFLGTKTAAMISSVLSAVGLAAGFLGHEEHAMPFGLIDPCYIYAAVLAASALILAKNYAKDKSIAK
jgi:hypothetical protein